MKLTYLHTNIMNQKAHKTIGHVSPQRPMTEEEKQMRIMQFLQQKREAFSINILCSLLQNNPGIHPDDVIIKAVDLADNLIKKLYPVEEKEEKPASDEPIQTDFD